MELRDATLNWGVRLPDLTDYDTPTWTPDATQQDTPFGPSWIDGLGRPKGSRLVLRAYVSAKTIKRCNEESNRVLSALRTATGLRDPLESQKYLILQGLIGDPKTQDYRGKTTRLITVTLALRDPYWHWADNDNSLDLYP